MKNKNKAVIHMNYAMISWYIFKELTNFGALVETSFSNKIIKNKQY